jgi:translation elongation factor P/translation initiation factor 5A
MEVPNTSLVLLSYRTIKKKTVSFNASDKVEIPVLETKNLLLVDVEENKFMSLLSDNDNILFEGIPIPKDDIGEIILKSYVSSDSNLIINMKGFKDNFKIMSCKEGEL